MSTLTSLAFYGKLPWVGDFVAHNMEYSCRQRIDQWLTSGVLALQESDINWLDRYLSAPVWNFMIPAGPWLTRPVVGALMPSVDRVGRYFPFIIFFDTDLNKDLVRVNYQLAKVAAVIPTLLEHEFALDEIPDFIISHVDCADESFLANVSFADIDFGSLPCFKRDTTYWWRFAGGEIIEFDEPVIPRGNRLFQRLFGSYI